MSDYLPPANGEETDLIAYAGRWVALLDGQIAGQGFSRESALESARDSRPKERPLVRLIPPPDGTTIYQILELIRPALPQDKPIYVVGGAVRDHLLQRPIHDLDFVITGNGIPPARAAANYLGGEFYALDEARGTGRVLLYRPDGRRLVLDFAAMRGKSLEEDQSGRDFTINSIAIDAQDPEKVFDPLGGAMDIRKKIIRACTQYAFEDDPLRVLRAVRLATGLGFQLTAETRTLLRESAPLLDLASGERQRDEILKILGGPKPAVSIRALEILGVLPHLFPEMLALKGLKQSSPHTLDVWEHTLSTLGYLDHILGVLGVLEHDPEASGNLATGLAVMRLGRYRTQIHNHLEDSSVPDRNWRGLLMLAALYHDAGKAETRSLDENGRIRFFKHEVAGARLIEKRANKLKLSNSEINRLRNIVRHHMRPHFLVAAEGSPTRRAMYRFFRDTQLAGVDICLLNLADVLATYERTLPQELWKGYLDVVRELLENWWERPAESIRPAQVISGRDLIEHFGLKPGPKIGEYLELVREAQATGEVEDRESALALVERSIRNDR